MHAWMERNLLPSTKLICMHGKKKSNLKHSLSGILQPGVLCGRTGLGRKDTSNMDFKNPHHKSNLCRSLCSISCNTNGHRLQICPFILEGNAQLVISAIKGDYSSPIWQLTPIIDDIRHLLGNWENWSIKINRSQNLCAHMVTVANNQSNLWMHTCR